MIDVQFPCAERPIFSEFRLIQTRLNFRGLSQKMIFFYIYENQQLSPAVIRTPEIEARSAAPDR
jgi:hypothetical protein